jgi:Cu2+-exporting ATPase
MNSSSITVPTPGSAQVSWADRSIHIRDESIFRQPESSACQTFLRRVLSVPGIRSIRVQPSTDSAVLQLEPKAGRLLEILDELPRAIRGTGETAPESLEWILPHPFSTEPFTVTRIGPYLTTWEVACDQPGRLRLRDSTPGGNTATLHRLERRFEHVTGVLEFRVRPLTRGLFVRFDPATTTSIQILRLLDAAVREQPASELNTRETAPARFGIANGSLALAVVGEFFLPILRPLSALLLLALNVDTLKTAGRMLLNKRLGLASLYSAIVLVTLASGQFLAASLMGWMIVFWNHHFTVRLARARRHLLGAALPQPLFVRRVAPGNVEVEVAIDRLQPDDLIMIAAGETIPADGRIDSGRGLIDERYLSGSPGFARRGPGDLVLAGSRLLSGELEVRVTRIGSASRASALASALYTAATHTPPSADPDHAGRPPLADRAVTPALATAGVGFLFADIVTAAAVLRPEYNTGLSLSASLESLQSIALGINHGIVIRDASALHRLLEVDLLVLDAHPLWQRPDIQVAGVSTSPGTSEAQLLAYAEAALRDLDDPRAAPLRAACRTQRVPPLRDRPVAYQPDITILSDGRCIQVGNYGTNVTTAAATARSAREIDRDGTLPPPDSLMVGVDSRIAGLIHFERSGHHSAAAAIRRLRAKNPLRVAIISDLSTEACSDLARTLELSQQGDAMLAKDRARFLSWTRERGLKTAFVADRRVVKTMGSEAHVCIAFDDQGSLDLARHSAPFVLLQPDLAKLSELWDIARDHGRRSRSAEWTTLVPNVLCIAGAFLLGFTSMSSVVLTNLGTYGLYARTSESLKKLERHVQRSRLPANIASGPPE